MQLPKFSAYHMISLSNLDVLRLDSPDEHDPNVFNEIVERVHQHYLAIRTEGCLHPTHEVDYSRKFFEDHQAGDYQYVFLSAGNGTGNCQSCFVLVLSSMLLISLKRGNPSQV